MEQQTGRTIAYLCPSCRQSVIVAPSLFTLAAAPHRVDCPCGKSSLLVEPEENRFQVTVPCLSCGKEHTVTCARHAFLEKRAIALSCTASGLPCAYVGEEAAVFSAVRRLEQAADHLPQPGEGTAAPFLNPAVMEEVLGELKELAARPDGITCTCGGPGIRVKVGYSAVDVTCAACGGVLRLPAAADGDLDDLCCQPALVIRGR